MEEIVVSKRPREETQVEEDVACEEDYSKRHKPYSHILSLLESEEEDSTQDLSPLITTLQQEITCASSKKDNIFMCPSQENEQLDNLAPNLEDCSTSTSTSTSFSTPPHSDDGVLKEEDGEGNDDKERVMRHLLEASDDELGIPNTGDNGFLDFGDDGFIGGDGFSSLCDNGLWELEDETANYYALLQSELFQ